MNRVWLSHPITRQTPLYGGASDLCIERDKQIASGDSCNTSRLRFSSHAGTHIDAPFHFLASGQTLDQYGPEDLTFDCPVVLPVCVGDGGLISKTMIPSHLPEETDIILFRTGFETRRNLPVYWQAGPGILPELAWELKACCSGLKAVGMDFISISSLVHRETGRAAHRAFLGEDILIVEDMSLVALDRLAGLEQVVVAPLRFENSDGAPCTVIGCGMPLNEVKKGR